MQFVGIVVRRRNELSGTVEDERCSSAPDFELSEEPREPGIFDDYRKHALPLLIDVDRTRKSNGRTLADRMVRLPEPFGILGLDSGLEPIRLGDAEVGRLETTIGEFDIPRHHIIFVDPALTGMIGERNLHHLQTPITELVGGKERAIGPTE